MEEFKYKLMQYSTIGWEETHKNLTREQCKSLIENILAEGVNPNHLKVELDDFND